MDRLAKLIDAYNVGQISIERLEQELNFQTWRENVEQWRRHKVLMNTVRNNMYNSFDLLVSKTPEEIIIEMDRQQEICKLLAGVREIIGDRDYELLMGSIVERWPHKIIAKKNNLARSTVTTLLNSIPKRVRRCAKRYRRYSYLLNKDFLLPEPSQLFAGTPEVRGYPFEFLQHVSVPGYWGKENGKRRFKIKTVCLLPEYFQESFRDTKTTCTLCDNCKGE